MVIELWRYSHFAGTITEKVDKVSELSGMELSTELDQLRRDCHMKVADSRLVTCTSEIIRVEIS